MRNNMNTIINKLKPTNSGCMEWSQSFNTDGYGKVSYNNKMMSVHRLVYFYYYPETKHSAVIHHICGNRKCSNIKHLQAINHSQNSAESFRVKLLLKELKDIKKLLISCKCKKGVK